MKGENPFKKVGGPQKEAPEHLKKKVMEGIEAIKLLEDVSTLFTFNYGTAVKSLFSNDNKKNIKKRINKKGNNKKE